MQPHPSATQQSLLCVTASAQTPQQPPYTCACAHVHSHHKGVQATGKSEPVGHSSANSHCVILSYCFRKCSPWRKLGREYKGWLLFLTNSCTFIIIKKNFHLKKFLALCKLCPLYCHWSKWQDELAFPQLNRWTHILRRAAWHGRMHRYILTHIHTSTAPRQGPLSSPGREASARSTRALCLGLGSVPKVSRSEPQVSCEMGLWFHPTEFFLEHQRQDLWSR